MSNTDEIVGIKNNRKVGGYSSNKLHMKRDHKRHDAEQRNHEHSLLSTNEKVDKAFKRRGNSKRELARLKSLLSIEIANEEKKQVVNKVNETSPKPVGKAVRTNKVVVKRKTAKKIVSA